MRKNLLLPGCLLLLLAACQHLPRHAPNLEDADDWQSHYTFLKLQNQWQLQGKIGFSFPYEDKHKLVSANLDWHKRDQHHYDMRLSGPLGMGEFVIEKGLDRTVLTNHQGRQFRAPSPEALFERHTGMSLPWAEMEWWVLGIPAPDIAATKTFREDAALLAGLEQSGWRVDYLAYQQIDDLFLPAKIKLYQGEMWATLIIRQWELH